MLSLGLSILSPAVLRGGITFDAASQAIFDSFTTPPSGARKTVINNYVVELKDIAAWDDIDILDVYAAADSQAAKINWKDPGTFTAVAVNAPTFTADRGYIGDGSTARLNTTWVPATHGVNFTQDNASIWCFSRTNIASSTFDIGSIGAGASFVICRNASNLFQGRANTATASSAVASSDSTGLFGVQRMVAASQNLWRNGVKVLDASAVASTGLAAIEQWDLGANSSVGGLREIAMSARGASLAGKELAFYNATLTYLQAVGAA